MKWLLLALALTACGPLVPATVPPQLDDTPGAPITFREGGVVLDPFLVPVPHGWRVVKVSTAQEPLRVILVAPPEDVLITASLAMHSPDNRDLPIVTTHRVDTPDASLYLMLQTESGAEADSPWNLVLEGVR